MRKGREITLGETQKNTWPKADKDTEREKKSKRGTIMQAIFFRVEGRSSEDRAGREARRSCPWEGGMEGMWDAVKGGRTIGTSGGGGGHTATVGGTVLISMDDFVKVMVIYFDPGGGEETAHL